MKLLMADEVKGSYLEKLNYLLADVFPTIGNQVAIFALLSFNLRKKFLNFGFIVL